MKMIKTLATKMVAMFSLLALLAAPTTAQALDAADMAFAFGGKGQAAQVDVASARDMTHIEMQETEGALFWPAIYGAAVIGTRAVMWAAPRLAPNTFRTVTNSRNAHTLMFNSSTGRHVCHVACGTGTGINGAHVGWGAGGRAGHNAANHIYSNAPWRINPW